MTHSSLNIFIYAFVNERFRDGFLTVLRRCVRSKPQNQAPTADVVSMMTLWATTDDLFDEWAGMDLRWVGKRVVYFIVILLY